ncbi:hypothetical protein GCM10010964_43740 [Caldovatus sediminis]|uniref:Uncharacterized protein n=1 Tax=Caldovatus sediminis TaxID=2041189 RepID=A0A8J2ZFN4_9PROT|nr:hypothetical protein [Caldovatus sediminis]GGG51803.1 hypothetical protein GCM10010964_43740 [Caldovatus sediminis]
MDLAIEVLGERLRVRASRSGRHWTLVAELFPEVRVCALDLARAKLLLAKRLRPQVERLRRRRAAG